LKSVIRLIEDGFSEHAVRMSIHPSPGKTLALALALSSMPAVVLADSFNSVVVYGDSLSDNGNLFLATGQPGTPYFDGRRSNGPVAVEQLATALGVPLHDFAWIGATTGIGNFADGGTPTSFGAFSLPGMQTELASTAGLLGPFLSSGLFVVWGGPNDFLSPSPLDSFPSGVIARGVSDLVGIVTALQGLGAKHILVPGMPDLGLTPFIEGEGPGVAAEFSAITDAFNAELRASLPSGALYFDTATLLRQMVFDPSAFGFTDVTDPCFNGVTVCAHPDQYLFWDTFHPTTATDSFVAKAFEAAVPEPATIVLLPAALLLCFVTRKQRPHQH
jgi:phospholipase/lecithinase/hemolysin